MKEVLVTINVTIDQEVLQFYEEQGNSDDTIKSFIKSAVNSAKIESGLVEDFEVESVEVKA